MSHSPQTQKSRLTVPATLALKGKKPITMLTAYDFPTATLLDQSGIDLVLVGDSLGSVIYGEPDTLAVTIEDMIRHGRAVTRACERALVVIDLPYLSYQVSDRSAVRNAGRILKETRAHAVKLEGGAEFASTARALTRAGIPVMAHIGLTPQFMNIQGHFRSHGKTQEEVDALLAAAQALEDAGCFSIVLECVTPHLSQKITQSLWIPTIGIGSGPHCDGQVLVFHDLVGLTAGHVPKFVTQELQGRELFKQAIEKYIKRVESPTTPPLSSMAANETRKGK